MLSAHWTKGVWSHLDLLQARFKLLPFEERCRPFQSHLGTRLFPCLVSLHIDPIPSDQECACRFKLALHRTYLFFYPVELGLCEFLPWTLASSNMSPDVVVLLSHGLNFVVLDLNLNVHPRGCTDGPIYLHYRQIQRRLTNSLTVAVSNVTMRPHPHISTISLHRFFYAFGIPVGTPVSAAILAIVLSAPDLSQ